MKAIASLVFVLPMCALAQAPAQPNAPQNVPPLQNPPQFIPAPPTKDPAARAAYEKQQKAYLAYQKCIEEHPAQFQLHSASSQVIRVRSNREAVEFELKDSPAFRARWPGGYDQIVAASFENYRKAGGTAPSVEAVVEEPHPCPPPTLPTPPKPAKP